MVLGALIPEEASPSLKTFFLFSAAQLPAFQYCDAEPLFIECSLEQRQWLTFQNQPVELVLVLVQVFMCMIIMKLFPMVPKLGRFIPASLVGLVFGTLIEHTLFRMAIGTGTRTVQETAPLSGSLPVFDWPAIPTDSTTVTNMFTYALTLAAIGSVESVLTLQACNEITNTVPKIADSNQELFAQGLANLVSGLFRAMGGDAMIGQSTINIMNGARHRVSSTMSGIFMLLFVVALSPLIDIIPVATLTGVLFMVVLSTFQWKTFMILRYGRLSDSIAIVLVTLVAVFFNLAVAIAAGIVFSALVHAWNSGAHVDADIVIKPMMINKKKYDEVKYVHLKGAIFFSSTRKFVNMFSVADDPSTVVIDFKDALVIDHSAVAAIQGISHRFEMAGKRVLLTNLAKKCHGRLHRTGNHQMLRRQISNDRVFEDIDVESFGANSAAAKERECDEIAALGPPKDTDEHFEERVDEYRVGEALSKLPMFQAPIRPVSAELAHLTDDQINLSLHSLHPARSGSRDQGVEVELPGKSD